MKKLLFLGLLLPSVALAGGNIPHNDITIINKYKTVNKTVNRTVHKHYNITEEITAVTNNYKISDEYAAQAGALSMAVSQHHFDMDTDKWQGSIGYGQYDSETAMSVSFAKRVSSDKDILLNGTLGLSGDERAAGFGVTFRF